MALDQIKGLLHATSLQNFERIIRTGAVICEMERAKLSLHHADGLGSSEQLDQSFINADQYPGVYMTAFIDFHHSKKINFNIGEVVFVFCVELLNREDYHINELDDTGLISNYTFTHYCRPIVRAIKEYDSPEFVFHHFVPLRYVSEIWFQDIKRIQGMEIPKHIRALIKDRHFYPKEVMSKPDIYVPKLQRHYIPNFDSTDLGRIHREQLQYEELILDRIKRMLDSYEFEDLKDDSSIKRDYDGCWQMIMLPYQSLAQSTVD